MEATAFKKIPTKFIGHDSLVKIMLAYGNPGKNATVAEEIFEWMTSKDKDNREKLDTILSGRYDFIGFGIAERPDDEDYE